MLYNIYTKFNTQSEEYYGSMDISDYLSLGSKEQLIREISSEIQHEIYSMHEGQHGIKTYMDIAEEENLDPKEDGYEKIIELYNREVDDLIEVRFIKFEDDNLTEDEIFRID